MQGSLNEVTEAHQMVMPDNVVQENHPELVLLETMPGGLRAIVVNYLWMRAEELKQEGKYHESRQLAEMICKLMPRQTGVWAYHAWNNAFNISVGTHTADERWEWVTSGVRLLRDNGIRFNPQSLELHKELGWIFWMKMGGQLDDMHKEYKSRWAGEMQYLLAAPPLGETSVVVDAFEPIAKARIIKPSENKLVQPGDWLVQPGPLEELLKDADVAALAKALKDVGVHVLIANDTGKREEDWKAELAMRSPDMLPRSFLSAYSRYSLDQSIQSVRLQRPQLKTERAQRVSAVINDARYADGRAKALAFLRAQVLWNAYKMDPSWMHEMMQVYGPLDWRSVQTHALYWMTYGFHASTGRNVEEIAGKVAAAEEYSARKRDERAGVTTLNSDRVMFNALKDLTWFGRVTLLEDQQWVTVPAEFDARGRVIATVQILQPGPLRPESPVVLYTADARFIEPLNKLMDHVIREVIAIENQAYEDSVFRAGHLNYMVSAMRLLYMLDRPREATRLYEEMKDNYKLGGDGVWDKDLGDLLRERMSADGGRPITSEGTAQITAGLVTWLMLQAVSYDQASLDRSQEFLQWALDVHTATNLDTNDRIRLAPFDVFAMVVARNLLISPEVYSMRLDIQDRAKLWRSLPDEWRLRIYDSLVVPLRVQCAQENESFETNFREPPGMREFRQQ
ncbi:MAG: hypothetical protein FWE88_02475 [Phycisphaerae bacterium]|nr:hypothetical protein [Phycisphaerae bacterium]